MSKRLLLVSGCYDGGLVGLECTADNQSQSVQFNPLFKFLAHQGSVKAISIGNGILATGGTDETVCLYDINKRVTYGSLQICRGTITALAWQHELSKVKKLLVATNTGKIYLFRAHDLEEICELNAHDEQILDMAIHPKGKVFISLGKDSKLKLWDLTTNLCVYNTTLSNYASSITFSGSGNNYAFISDRNCTISSVTDQFKPIGITTTDVLTCITFIEDDTVLLGTNNGSILACLFLQSSTPRNLIKQECRLKSLKVFNMNNNTIVLAANSKGDIYCWKYINLELIQIGYFKTETRLITMQVSHMK